MIATTNNTVNISRYTTISGESTYGLIITWLDVYIEAKSWNDNQWFDWQTNASLYVMMSNGVQDIQIGDRIVDKNNIIYTVENRDIFDDMSWKHWEYILNTVID